MTGIEKITGAIIKQVETEAAQIITSAKASAGVIINDAQERSSADSAVIFERARKEATLTEHINRSNAQSLSRKKLLAVRQEIIDSVIEKALDKMRNLPADEYFAALEKLCIRYAMNGSGELIVSDADKKRMPADFIEKVNSKLSVGKSLTLSHESAQLSGGFILRYGGIEENCSFDALAEEQLDSISDMLQTLLFD